MFGLFKNKAQDWAASIQPAGQHIEVKAGDNLLNAALSAGLAWPHDCRVGSCGTCRCTLKEGKIKPLADFSYVLDGDELDQGMILACQTSPRSDLVVEVSLDSTAPAVAIESTKGVIVGTKLLTHDIVELRVRVEGNVSSKYVAGQYAELQIPSIEKPRSYSFAKAPSDSKEVVFYIRKVPGGEFTEWLFETDRIETPLDIRGPFGSFWLRPSESKILCIAGGSGLAPIKSVLENAINEKVDRDVLFLFGAREERDLYCVNEMQQIKSRWTGSNFDFVPVLSEEAEGSDWQGARGLVTDYLTHQYIDGDGIDLGDYQAYLCGPPPMIDAALDVIHSAGLPQREAYFDKFLDASTMPDGR